MGWGDVISIAITLQQMKMHQAGEQLMREFFNTLRSGMFNLNQTAEDVLRSEPSDPLKAAGAMRILDYELTSSGLTPDVFTDLSDKKFAADTARLIKGNSSRMYVALDKDGQAQVDQLVEYVRRLPEYHNYLENLDEGDELRDASEVVYSGAPSRLLMLALLAGALSIFLFVSVVGMNISSYLLMLIGFFLLISVVIMAVLRWRVSKAQQTIEKLEGIIDLERFTAIEEEFESPEDVEAMQRQAEQFIEDFFGDYTLLDQGWRT